MRLTSTKWPRWLVPNCSLEAVGRMAEGRRHHAGIGDDQVEGLARRRRSASAQARTLASEARSSCDQLDAAVVGAGAHAAGAASALARSRAAPTTSAPCAASARAVSTPSPAETPVTSTRLPLQIDAGEHLVRGRGRTERVRVIPVSSQA